MFVASLIVSSVDCVFACLLTCCPACLHVCLSHNSCIDLLACLCHLFVCYVLVAWAVCVFAGVLFACLFACLFVCLPACRFEKCFLFV